MPCLKCHSDGVDCVLAGSRRGGNHARRKLTLARDPNAQPTPRASGAPEIGSLEPRDESERPRERSRDPNCGSVQNPFQALRLLVQAAADAPPAAQSDADDHDAAFIEKHGTGHSPDGTGLDSYILAVNGTLSLSMIEHLLE